MIDSQSKLTILLIRAEGGEADKNEVTSLALTGNCKIAIHFFCLKIGFY